MRKVIYTPPTRRIVFTLTLLAIEFLDEFVFGAREAAWPLIRTDLGLSYAQVGLLLGLPSLISSLVEPFLGILGDIWRRRVLILGGGVVFALALLLTALSQDFPVLLISFIIFYPASGAFVSLLGFFNTGWYSILKAQLYSAMPGQSGTVMTVGNVFGLVGGLIPLGLGLVAERFDLVATMWLLLLGPLALLIGIPKRSRRHEGRNDH